MELSNELIFEKVFHLAKVLEKKVSYDILEPWRFNSHDMAEVQNAASKISNFLGMPNLYFVVTYMESDEKTAGHIELNNTDEGVFVEISEAHRNDHEIVLAILAHEICHKYLQVNRLTLFGYENEILTDITTVYTGLGKLSLNGCEKILCEKDHSRDSSGNWTTKTSTTTRKVGYLTRKQFAFVYSVIGKMRKMPFEVMINNLNADAISCLKQNTLDLSPELCYNDYVIREVNDYLHNLIEDLQIKTAVSFRAIRIIGQILNLMIIRYIETHKKIQNVTSHLYEQANLDYHSDSLNFIKNLILMAELPNIENNFINERNDYPVNNKLLSDILNQIRLVPTNIKQDNFDFLFVFQCPICENKMRLKQNKRAKVRCPKCKYSFIIDNSAITNPEGENSNILKESKIRRILKILKE
jgi:hypothetical protein